MSTTRPSSSLFEQALAALPDGVLLIGASRRVLYANPAFARHWRISDELLAAGNEADMLQFAGEQIVDPAAFLRGVERVHASSERFEDQIRFKDGRIFSRRSVPVVEAGVFEARIWIFTDITEASNASVDSLTALPNRHAYSRLFPPYMGAPADGLVRAVGMIDVDNFKAYNDRYGHAAGDAVLRSVGEVLRSSLKNSDDLVFRIGGEEFLIALKARSASAIHQFFEALRHRVETLGITHAGNAPHSVVTASFGIAVFDGPAEPSEVIQTVDRALYDAKRRGRNRVSPDAAPLTAAC
ncbi:MAG: sensor domain-containing diguanylate cyclase [Sphingomonadaceae bacterium]|nr:sensor domain-containing diguanylate cyclase [Sphingomonadaceae bacterium]